MTPEEIAAMIKQMARERDWDLAGICAPQGDGLPHWVGSVVVLGLYTPDDAYDFNTYVEIAGRRRWHKFAYEALVARAALLALDLNARGIRAEPLTFVDSARLVNLREAAVQAGLGTRGLNGLVVTREFGPRVRFGAVFVEPQLPPDAPIPDYYCASCTICISRCPTGALTPWGFDRSLCVAEFDPSPEMRAKQKRETKQITPFTRLQCNLCVSSCPIGKKRAGTWWDGDAPPVAD